MVRDEKTFRVLHVIRDGDDVVQTSVPNTDSRHDSSFIEFESHIGRALLLALKSITMPKN